MQRVFEALSSTVRRKILAYLAHTEMTAGEIAARFEMSKPAISKHLQILENAGLVTSEKRGQFVWYSLRRDALVGAIAHFMQTVEPYPKVGTPPRSQRPRERGDEVRR